MAISLGRYRLDVRIAQGGMGEVFRGVDVGWGGVERPVAVKVIAPELARVPEFVKTFQDEARLSYQLSHSNVVHVRDIGRLDDTYFIAMEWVEGADLASVMVRLESGPRQPLPTRFAVLIAIEAARGLDYAHRLCDQSGHALGLVHRDVSPPNLLLSYEGEVKLSDFGVARWRMREQVSLPGSLKGKISYMAPEQARGEEVDARADVFALGVVLYEMLTGRNPFSGTRAPDARRESDREIIERVRAGVFSPPSTVTPVAPSLEAIVMRAMAPARDERYATCAAMREDLEAFARREAYNMSLAQLGEFVRSVMELHEDPALARTDRVTWPTPTVRRSAQHAVQPFDQVLGAGLAALSGGEEAARATQQSAEVPATTPSGMPTTQMRKLPKKEPGALPIISAGDLPDEAEPVVPRRRLPLAAAVVLGLLLGGGVASLAWWRARPEPAPQLPATPTTATTAPIAPPRTMAPATAPATTTPPHARAPAKARPAGTVLLTVETDVDAEVFVDGDRVGVAPVKIALAPGSHRVRADGGEVGGIRLLPREQTIELHDGERAQSLRLVLRQ